MNAERRLCRHAQSVVRSVINPERVIARRVLIAIAGLHNMENDFDVIVMGSGAGGGTAAADLAHSGLNVLLVERGSAGDRVPADERTTLIDQKPYDDRSIDVNGNPLRLYMGGVPGGSTSVYGGALLRPAEDDFHPGKHYDNRLPKHLWDWPVTYDELQPWYDKAEQLYRVSADRNDDLSPLGRPHPVNGNSPLALAAVNERVVRRSRDAKYRPFRLPLSIESKNCLRCANCAGFVCPTGARQSSDQLAEAAISAGRRLTVLRNHEVVKLHRTGDQIGCVTVVDRQQNRKLSLRSQRYVLSAGAIGSTAVLLKSGFEHDQIGRNYMMHLSPLAVGIFPRSTEADQTFVKQLGFSDFYFGTSDLSEKMGLVQSLPAPGPLMLRKSGLRFAPTFVLNLLRRFMLPFVGIIEDLPQSENRVRLNKNGRISLSHRFSAFDDLRAKALTAAMSRLLKASGAVHCVTKSMPSQQHVAHQCGTIRFGNDPRHAPVNRDCRMYDAKNLFVVDGSILPTSTGVGPSLTLIANALRVSATIAREV